MKGVEDTLVGIVKAITKMALRDPVGSDSMMAVEAGRMVKGHEASSSPETMH
jgi:hypothetical protein